MLNVAILGCGSRGTKFAKLMRELPDKYNITALCDTDENHIKKLIKVNELKDVKTFTNPDDFFNEKHGDVVIIATYDREHVPQAVKAMEKGYDLLLEKPLSDSREELDLLMKTQKKTGRKIVVCHELRYGPGYTKCAELIKSGIIGRLYSIDHTERVSYWHWAHAYVRGVCSTLKDGHPALLAKCSHDLDLIQSYAGSKCDTISSVGGLDFFTHENAPDGAADRCLDCKHQDSCPYSAKRIYIDMWYEMGKPEYRWPFYMVTNIVPHTEDAIREALKDSQYGRCAFKCNTEKVDHQLVQMTFENGVKASLKMIYTSVEGRRIVFYGTHGEIVFDERPETITIAPYGCKEEIINVNKLSVEDQSHGGGDAILIKELYDIMTGQVESITPLSESIESHLMGIASEESRKLNGELVKVHKQG